MRSPRQDHIENTAAFQDKDQKQSILRSHLGPFSPLHPIDSIGARFEKQKDFENTIFQDKYQKRSRLHSNQGALEIFYLADYIGVNFLKEEMKKPYE